MSFTTPLVLVPHQSGPGGLVHQDLVYENGKHTFTVPEGFSTDFASVPRALWILCPPWGKYQEAAVLHDWLYLTKPITRKEADRLFLKVMITDGTKIWRATIMFYMVRWFGGKAWRKS